MEVKSFLGFLLAAFLAMVPQNAQPKTTVTTVVTTAKPTIQTGVPQNPSTVTCDFEGGFCAWTQQTDDQRDWTRYQGSTDTPNTGPTRDHTTGNGYYICLEVSVGSPGDKARLLSKTITPSEPLQCLTFWYHMRGSNVASLNVYLKIGTQPLGNAHWTRSGDHGNVWKKASVSINDSVPYAVVLEAVHGTSFTGDIAVDDVRLDHGLCSDITSTPGATIRTCDFEDSNNMCGYTQDLSDNFNWQITSQSTVSPQTGPSSDHTYQTSQGHYVFIDASNIQIGAKARLLSPSYNYSSLGACLHFYYYMYGDGVGTLNVYIKLSSQTTLGQPVWHVSGNQGQRWIAGALSVLVPTSYQVVFEGVRGQNFRADIAIDDISFTAGTCFSPGSCNFEGGLCTWTNMASNKFEWNSYTADTKAGTPAGDHTLGSKTGNFLFLPSNRTFRPGDKAELISETFPPTPTSQRCMIFSYFMSGNVQTTLNIAVTTPDTSQTLFMWQLINTSPSTPVIWHMANVPILANTKNYFVTIQGVYGTNVSNPTGGIGIDDIMFRDSSCTLFPNTAVPKVGLPTSPLSTTQAPAGIFDCTFEQDFCGWQQDNTDKFDWTRQSGTTSSYGTGPNGDHTKADGSGQYIYIETSSPRVSGDKARIISPDVIGGTYCLQFYYNMYGADINSLVMYVKTGLTLPTPAWTLHGAQGNSWHLASVDITTSRIFNIIFEGVSGPSFLGDIALDDISMSTGTCASLTTAQPGTISVSCTFEVNLCGFQQDQTDNFDWTRNKGGTSTSSTGPIVDHSVKTTAGYYMYIESSSPRKADQKARLESALIPSSPTLPVCVNFWYSMYGSTMGTLNIYIKTSSGLGPVVWTRQNNQGTDWKESTVSVPPSNSQFTVVFEGVVGNGIYSDIALDDITISTGDCSRPGNCNFDFGFCSWLNDFSHDNYNWMMWSLLANPASTVAFADHTMNNASGKYIYFLPPTSPIAGSKAWFVSQDLSPNMSSCFHFWYRMQAGAFGNLNVWVQQSSDGSRIPIWSLTGNQGTQWNKGQAAIPPQNGGFQIIFEAVIGSATDSNINIAIDDITLDNLTGCALTPSGAKPSFGAITVAPTVTSTAPASVTTTNNGTVDTGHGPQILA